MSAKSKRRVTVHESRCSPAVETSQRERSIVGDQHIVVHPKADALAPRIPRRRCRDRLRTDRDRRASHSRDLVVSSTMSAKSERDDVHPSDSSPASRERFIASTREVFAIRRIAPSQHAPISSPFEISANSTCKTRVIECVHHDPHPPLACSKAPNVVARSDGHETDLSARWHTPRRWSSTQRQTRWFRAQEASTLARRHTRPRDVASCLGDRQLAQTAHVSRAPLGHARPRSEARGLPKSRQRA